MGSVLFVSKSGWVDRDIGSSGGGVNNRDGDDDKVDTISSSSNKTVTSPWVREIEMVEAARKAMDEAEIPQEGRMAWDPASGEEKRLSPDATRVKKMVILEGRYVAYGCLRCGEMFTVVQGSRARYCRGCRKKVAGPGRGKKKVEKTQDSDE